MRADRDGNGKITREEIDAFFKAADSGGEGFLSLSDLQEAFAPPPARSGAARRLGPAFEGHARAGPVPPGDRLASTRPQARRVGA